VLKSTDSFTEIQQPQMRINQQHFRILMSTHPIINILVIYYAYILALFWGATKWLQNEQGNVNNVNTMGIS
jgi:hypothetical protein